MTFLFRKPRVSSAQRAADQLHDALIETIRQPIFYIDYAVPDTFEGRFDLLILHAGLVFRRLRDFGVEGSDTAQSLVDTMFARFDIAMRELGVSDIAVPKRMKRLAEGFKGRTSAYDHALISGDAAELAAAVSRNVTGGATGGHELAAYVADAERRLQGLHLDDLQRGSLPFGNPANFLR